MATVQRTDAQWHKTACILCTVNCGLEVQVADGHFVKIKGDKAHPMSQGYQCQKALRLDYYQNGKNRLTKPLRRKADGTFEAVSWDTAIREAAAKLVQLRDTHGGHALAYYGGGGQGNHLGGAYGGCLRSAMGTSYLYTSLAQEKTGGFWVDGKLFGRQNCHPTEDAHNADYLIVIGANPWQAHGIQQARKLLQDLASDSNKTLVVVDPRRTESAEKADIHLQVRPGGDAHLMLAMLGTIVQEGLEDKKFLSERTVGFEEVRALLLGIPVDDYAREAGVAPDLVRQVARGYAAAERACIRTDLGLEHTLHSTLNAYLAKLLYLVTGHFGKPGTNTFHTSLFPLAGHSKDPEEGGMTTQVTGTREIGKLYPPNVLPLEIDSDHPKRIRGLVVDSSNPIVTGADTQAYRKAFEKLELLVVIDVALTETARMAHYVLPAQSQYEKAEATFFNIEFPVNAFHLRRPVVEPSGDTLPEPEIYRRLLVAMGELPDSFPGLEEAARKHRADPKSQAFPMALAQAAQQHPNLQKYAPLVLYATLGKALPKGMDSAAVLWLASNLFAQKNVMAAERAGILDEGAGLAEAVFQRILDSESGCVISVNDYEDTWEFIKHADGKIHLAIPEMFDEIRVLEPEQCDHEFPLILQSGERRAYNANTIYRHEGWRKKDQDGALKVHPSDAERYGLVDGEWAECETRRGCIQARVAVTDELREGMVSLPHGYGMEQQDGNEFKRTGPAINLLTETARCDAIAKTPFHKYVPVRVRAVVPAASTR